MVCIGKEGNRLKAREYIRQNMNVPNVLTLIRLLLVPVYIALFAMGDRYAALTVFLLASLRICWMDKSPASTVWSPISAS